MPRFKGEEHPNVFHVEGTPPFTDAYKEKCRESVRKHNKHNCAVAINGCKTTESDLCKGGYSNTETRPDTYLDATTDRIVYRWRKIIDLLIVPYNLLIMMDLDTMLVIKVPHLGDNYHCGNVIKLRTKHGVVFQPISRAKADQLPRGRAWAAQRTSIPSRIWWLSSYRWDVVVRANQSARFELESVVGAPPTIVDIQCTPYTTTDSKLLDITTLAIMGHNMVRTDDGVGGMVGIGDRLGYDGDIHPFVMKNEFPAWETFPWSTLCSWNAIC